MISLIINIFYSIFIETDVLSNTAEVLERIKLCEPPKSNDSKYSKKSDKTEKASEKEQNEAKTTETQDPKKKLKNLKKRLREVEALEEKLEAGSLQNPEKDQLMKIKRKNDLLLQIRELEKQCQESI